MVQTTGKILKGNDVNIEGKFHLGMPQADTNSSQNINTVVRTPQAKMIENNEGYVVIQIICSCGKEIYIKGEYPESQTS